MLIAESRSLLLGDLSEGDPPVPIPNTEVKLLSPDGTAQATVWESRKSPGLNQTKPSVRRAFSFDVRCRLLFDVPNDGWSQSG